MYNPANEKESLLVLRHLERQINFGISMNLLALDCRYDTGAVHRGMELLGITEYILAIQFSHPPEKYGLSYDSQLDAVICPKGVPITYHRLNCNKSTGKYLRCNQVEGNACMRGPKRPSCFDKAGIWCEVLASNWYPAFFRKYQSVRTPEYLSMMRLRKIWGEGDFSVLKREHRISKKRLSCGNGGMLSCSHGPKSWKNSGCHFFISNSNILPEDLGGRQNFFFCQQIQSLTLPS